MPEDERTDYLKKTFGFAFSEWRNLNVAYRKFLVALIKSERQQFVEFVRKDTVLGEFLYELKDKELFVRILNLLEQPSKKHRTSYRELAFSILLGFSIELKVKGLSDKIRYAKAETDDLFELFKETEIS